MNETACMTCGSSVENTAVSGVFCQACYEAELSPPRGWRDLLRGPNAGAIGFGMAPFVLSFEVNGLDFIALGCGAIAATLGLAGLWMARKSPDSERTYRLSGAGLALLLGLLQVGRAFL